MANIQELLLILALHRSLTTSRAFLKWFQGKTMSVRTAGCLGRDPASLNASREFCLKVIGPGEHRKGVSLSSTG